MDVSPTNNEEALVALMWIADILNKNEIPYRVGGGTAVYLYGSGRPINDIDISVSGADFPRIIPLLREYIVAGPLHYLNDKWDCTTLSLKCGRQDIDLTDVDTLLMLSANGTQWIKNKEIYERWPDVQRHLGGIMVTLMNPRVLLDYKEHLGGPHQEADRAFLKKIVEC